MQAIVNPVASAAGHTSSVIVQLVERGESDFRAANYEKCVDGKSPAGNNLE